MAAVRRVVVDNTSPLIHYEGSWFLDDTGAHDAKGNFGPVYNKSLHATITSGSFSFAYTGSSIVVFGSNNVHNDSAGVLDPQWTCSVDGVSLPTHPFNYFENNWPLCDTNSTQIHDSNGSHVLTVNATVQRAQAFYLDRLVYTPSPDASFVDETIHVQNNDPELQFGPGWEALGAIANLTAQTGSQFVFYFHGTSVSWYAFLPKEKPGLAATGTYAVDDQPPASFPIKAVPQGKDVTEYNQEIFRTPEYPRGRHKLQVTFLGNAQTVPLVLDYLVIRNGTGPGRSDIANVGTSDSRHRLRFIIGGTLGGMAILLLAILIAFYVHRRRKLRVHDETQPQHPQVEPSPQFRCSTTRASRRITAQNAPQFLPSSKIIRLEGQSSSSVYIPTSSGYVSNQHVSSPSTMTEPFTPQSSRSGTGVHNLEPRLVVHEDSGIRNVLPLQEHVEIPPTYTPT
ncbi:hypothetical protein CVT24_011171 [Panaeolus cyanescens]|uniref:Uncharacterized protein n=1 Tax=Panaeolus cyanescens TaxID=181874 RepID=A0A409YGG3_9AGAR|nr:hypothetical protein CVT24_011171 [Panaeolus cyanescens]